MEDSESTSSAASTDNDEYSYKYIVQEVVYTVSQRCYFSEVQSKVQSIVQSKVHSPGLHLPLENVSPRFFLFMMHVS